MAKTTLKLPSKMTRFASIETRATPPEDGVYTASFSSETPVSRWFGAEILGHAEGEYDFGALMNVGAILVNHDPNQRAAVPVRAYVKNGRGFVDFRFPDTPFAQATKTEVDAGLLRGISVGYSIDEMKLTKSTSEGDDEYRAVKWRAREVSLTPIPADTTVGVGRSAEAEEIEVAVIADDVVSRSIPVQEPKIMDENKKESGTETTPAPTNTAAPAATAERKTDIVKRDEAELANLAWCARELGVSGEDLLAASHSPRPMNEIIKGWRDAKGYKDANTPVHHAPAAQQTSDNEAILRASIADALLIRAGELPPDGKIVRRNAIGETKTSTVPIAPRALELSQLGPMDLVRVYADSLGIRTVGKTKQQILHAVSHRSGGPNTTASFATVLENTTNKIVIIGYSAAMTNWRSIAKSIPANDLRQHNLYSHGGMGSLSEIAEAGEIPAATKPDGKKEVFTPATFSKMFTITDDVFINDDLGAFNGLTTEMGEAADVTVNEWVFYQLLRASGLGPTMNEDSTALFDASAHTNYATGASSNPSATTLDTAYAAFLKKTGLNGKPIPANFPSILLCPTALWGTVSTFLNSTYLPGTDNYANVENKYKGRLTPVFEPALDLGVTLETKTGNVSGTGSSTAWYLFADPATRPTIVVGFYGGETPEVRSERPIDLIGSQFRVLLRFGVGVANWRFCYKHKNAS